MSTILHLWMWSLSRCWSRFLLLILLSFTEVTVAHRNIFTIPSSSTFATGYRGLIVSAQFPTSDVSASCVWKYPGRTTSSFIVVVSGITCNPVNNPPVETVSCVNNGTTISSNLTILQPLSAGSLDVTVECDGKTIRTLPSTTVHGCTVSNNCFADFYVSCKPCEYESSTTIFCHNQYTGMNISAVCQADATFAGLSGCPACVSRCLNNEDTVIISVISVLAVLAIILFPLLLKNAGKDFHLCCKCCSADLIVGIGVGLANAAAIALLIVYSISYQSKGVCYGVDSIDILSGWELFGVVAGSLGILGGLDATMLSYYLGSCCF